MAGFPRSPGVLSWQHMIEIGRAEPDSILQERLQQQAVNQACTLVYTSGTTGNPKVPVSSLKPSYIQCCELVDPEPYWIRIQGAL